LVIKTNVYYDARSEKHQITGKYVKSINEDFLSQYCFHVASNSYSQRQVRPVIANVGTRILL
jgi:hypothetical protein